MQVTKLDDFIFDLSEASTHIDFVHEKRHMHVLLEAPTPPPPLETSRTFFDFAQAPVALFIGRR